MNSYVQKIINLDSPLKNSAREKLIKEMEEKQVSKIIGHLSNLEFKLNHSNENYQNRLQSIKINIGKIKFRKMCLNFIYSQNQKKKN